MEILVQLRAEVETLKEQHSSLKLGLRDYHTIYYMEVRPFFMRATLEDLREQIEDYADLCAARLLSVEEWLSTVKQVDISPVFDNLVQGLVSEIDNLRRVLFEDVKQTIEVAE